MERRVTFYEETNFKTTEIGEIPADWEVVKLGDIFEEVDKNERKVEILPDKEYKLVLTKLYANGIQLKEVKYGRDISASHMYLLRAGDFIFSKINVRKGAFDFVSAELDGAVVSTEHPILNIDLKASDPKYVKFFLSQPLVWELFRRESKGFSGKERVKVREFFTVPIPLPPLEEQKAIAYVLSTVQEAREKTEKVIEATKELKKSLMKHLFTYGPVSLEEASRINLKETEIGEIPADWEVVKLEQVGEVLTGNTPSKAKKEYWINGTIDFVKPPDLRNSCITTASEKISEYAVHVARLVPGSVLVSCVGNIGRVGYSLKKIAFNQQINAIVPNDTINSIYLFFALQTQAEQIEKLKAVTTIPIVNKSKFMKVLIPLPPLEEQKAIAYVLSTVQEAREKTEKVIEATKELKKSLMKHLFTYGPVSLEEASRINLKETEIGEIPADWEVVKLEQVGEVLTGNTPSKAKKEYWINGTIDFVKPPDLRNSCITTASEKISEYAVHVARLVPPGSVLVS